MAEMKNMTIYDFSDAVAAGEAVPGGGSVAALAGSLGAALVGMVANLTKDSDELEGTAEKAGVLRRKLLDVIDEDSRSFNKVMDAYRMPRKTPIEKEIRKQKIQDSLKYATEVPLKTAELAYSVMELSEKVVEHGNRNAVTDAAVSAMMARTAVLSAILNIRINLSSIRDQEYREEMDKKVDRLETTCREYENRIIESIDF